MVNPIRRHPLGSGKKERQANASLLGNASSRRKPHHPESVRRLQGGARAIRAASGWSVSLAATLGVFDVIQGRRDCQLARGYWLRSAAKLRPWHEAARHLMWGSGTRAGVWGVGPIALLSIVGWAPAYTFCLFVSCVYSVLCMTEAKQGHDTDKATHGERRDEAVLVQHDGETVATKKQMGLDR